MISQALRAGVISSSPPHQPSPVTYLITIQYGGIESLIYLAFRSKITAALQANILNFQVILKTSTTTTK